MKKQGLLGALAMVLAVCLALAGCGGSAGSAADAAQNFVGTWEVSSITSDGEETSADDLELLKSLGMSVYLTLNEDGSASLEMFGVPVDGTWEGVDATTATLTVEGDGADEAGLEGSQEMKVKDGVLSMEADDEQMTFVQIDPEDKVATDLSSLLKGVDTSDLGTALEGVESELESADAASTMSNVTDLDITVADDALCAIKVTAMGDYYGDPGYVLSVQNKGDTSIVVEDNNEFDVNGTVASPIFSMQVDAGQTGEEILWFDNSELNDGGVDALTNVKGKLVVKSATGDELGTYDFAA